MTHHNNASLKVCKSLCMCFSEYECRVLRDIQVSECGHFNGHIVAWFLDKNCYKTAPQKIKVGIKHINFIMNKDNNTRLVLLIGVIAMSFSRHTSMRPVSG